MERLNVYRCSMKIDPILELFKIFLKENGYSCLSTPMNTRHADMFIAFKAGLQGLDAPKH